jgi:hypothetical protein
MVRRTVDIVDHFFVMVGQLVDNAVIGDVPLIVRLTGGKEVEGIPTEPASDASPDQQLDDTGYARRIELAGTTFALSDVRRATIVHPAPD